MASNISIPISFGINSPEQDDSLVESRPTVTNGIASDGPRRKSELTVNAMLSRQLEYDLSNPNINKRMDVIQKHIRQSVLAPQQAEALFMDNGNVFSATISPPPGDTRFYISTGRISSDSTKERYLKNTDISSAQLDSEIQKITKKISSQTVPKITPHSNHKINFVDRGNTQSELITVLNIRTVSTSESVKKSAESLSGVSESKIAYGSIGGGIQIKKRTRASLRLKRAPGDGISSTADFFLTDVRETTNEKFQIIQTFGSDFLFAFGRRPLMYTFSGVLYNTQDKQWKNNLRFLYDNKFRATQLIKSGRKAVLSFEDTTVEGYLLNMDMSLSSQNPNAVPFSFTMYITRDLREGITIADDDLISYEGINA